jgi:DHA2 family multidrug resistance protein
MVVTICTILATLMQSLDSTIANVALPYMQGTMSASQEEINWVLTSYIVAAAIMTAPTGFLAARLGRTRLFVTAVVGFTVASALCGLAETLGQIVVFRVIQGMFGAALEACIAGISFYVFLVQFCLAPRPFLSPKLFADRNFSVGAFLYAIMGLIMYASLALLAPYLQTLMNYPVVTAGITLAPRGAGLMIAALICGRVMGKVSARLLVGIGFLVGAYALYEMTLFTPDISETTVVMVGFIQGISIGFLAIPINIIAFATLPATIRTEATSIYSLMRNLGSAIGISVTGALLQTNTQINHALIAEDVSPFNRALQAGEAARFWSIGSVRGIAMLNGEVTHQAQIIAYIDDFKLMLVLAILVVPLLLFVRTPRTQ